MTIFIAADHRGFELKNQLIEYLHEKNIRIEDLGNYQLEPEDDYPDYAKKVAQAVQQNLENHLGIIICASGVGVTIVANRYKGIRCGLGFDVEQIKHTRENDHINVLAIASEYPTKLDNGPGFEKVKNFVDAFLETQPNKQDKYLRRIKKLDEI